MPIVPFKNIEHVIYEHLTEKKLIAIEKAESKKIAEFEKLNKSKKQKPRDKVSGHWFVLDEEYNSLKIDFSVEVRVEIRELELFPLK